MLSAFNLIILFINIPHQVKSVMLVGKQQHPDIQTKKHFLRYFSLIFFQPALELIKAVGRSLLLDFSFMTDQAFFLSV